MKKPSGDEGFALIVLVVMIFVILLFLAVAAPLVARDLQHEKELEAVHRANQYVRAIQLYYRKNSRYPTSIDALEKSNNIRFLRRKYEDPLTGKADWRIIHAGENKTTVKGLFGKPLAGIGTAIGGSGLGTSTISGTSNPGSFGSSSSFGSAGATGAAGSTGGISGGTQTVDGTSGSGSGGISSQSATTFQGGGGPIMGIGSSKSGDSILVVNEQTTYQDWEFLYDPRIEQLRSKSSLFGGGVTNGGGGIGGSTPGVGIGGSTGSTFGSPGGFGGSSGSTGSAGSTGPTTP